MSDNKKRMENIEVARCISMLMIIILHFNWKGGFMDGAAWPANPLRLTVELIESLSIVAVNVYMLITGYFLAGSKFKPRKLLVFWLRVFFFSAIIGLFVALTGIVHGADLSTYTILMLIAPVLMGHYWYVTAYVFLFLITPLIVAATDKLTKKQLGTVICLMLFVHSLIKTIAPFKLEADLHGNDFMWYIVMALIAAYIKLYGLKLIDSKAKCLALYFGFSALIFIERIGLAIINSHAPHFNYILTVMYDYNHFFVLMAALGLFGFFLNCKFEKCGKLFAVIAPYTLGVYLFHENIIIRFEWPKWFGAATATTPLLYLGKLVIAVICIFALGAIIDFVRDMIFRFADRLLDKVKPYKSIKDKLDSLSF